MACTYQAFARSSNAWRPWITLVAASGVTTFTKRGAAQDGPLTLNGLLSSAFLER